MIQDIKFIIREKKRSEWIDLFKGYFNSVFSWIENHGKFGFLIAFIAGMFCVMAFKLILSIAFLALLVCGTILLIAEE